MEATWKKYGGSVQFVAIQSRQKTVTTGEYAAYATNQESVQHFINKHGITFPVVNDPDSTPNMDVGIKYLAGGGGLTWPIIFIIGPDKIIRDFHTGSITASQIEGMIEDVINLRKPVALEMLMDVSDSMNSTPYGTTASKFDLMKQASSMITEFLDSHSQTDDEIGLIWFTDGVTEYSTGTQKLVQTQGNSGQLKVAINAAVTGTCTAMGPGLQTAFDTLQTEATAAQKKFAILCTDGMQNIEPNVIDVGGHYEIKNEGGWCGPGSSVPEHPGVDITTYDTAVHTIGIGIAATYEPLLQGIANRTGGFYIGTNDPAVDLDLAYFVQLCNCLSMGSPAVVFHNSGILHTEECQVVEQFCINSSSRKLTVMLNWQDKAANLVFWLRAPDGTLLKPNGMKIHDNYSIMTMYLPVEQDGRLLPYVGNWEMIIRGEMEKDKAAYHSMAVVEDREAKFSVDYPRKFYETGDIVPITVSLGEKNQPAMRVRDIIMERSAPRFSLAELLNLFKVPEYESQMLSVGEMHRRCTSARLQAKLAAIEKNPRFTEQSLTIRNTQGLTAGTLNCIKEKENYVLPVRLERSGLTTFKISVRSYAHDGSPVCRTQMISVHAGPGAVDPKRTVVNIVPTISERLGGISAYIVPKNTGGQLIGPGYEQVFKIRSGKKELEAAITDMLDGSYHLEFALRKKSKEMTQVNILFQDNLVWGGEV